MADPSEIGTSIVDITNPTRICNKRDLGADSAEIGSKVVHTTIHTREGLSSSDTQMVTTQGPTRQE